MIKLKDGTKINTISAESSMRTFQGMDRQAITFSFDKSTTFERLAEIFKNEKCLAEITVCDENDEPISVLLDYTLPVRLALITATSTSDEHYEMVLAQKSKQEIENIEIQLALIELGSIIGGEN